MFLNQEPRATVQSRGKNSEIVVIHIEQNNEIRGTFPKSTQNPVLSYDSRDSRHVTRADLPFVTIGVFHVHPNISHGAAKEDVRKGIMPLLTGDANKSANTFSKLQSVYNPEHGLMNYIMGKFKNLWNGTQDMPLAERMDFTMSTSCTIKSIARHHLYMKEGSGFDRTFPGSILTFVFSWGKIQQEFRQFEIAKRPRCDRFRDRRC